ncbi:MAG: hypothetical protein ABMA13_00705 [Chthoniobacteraceae bacterium]
MTHKQKLIVRLKEGRQREYELHELVWLWRTAELPHDAAYLDAQGEWQPVEQLVGPIIQAQDESRVSKASEVPKASAQRDGRRWKFAVAALAALLLLSAPYVHESYTERKAAQAEADRVAEWERSERFEDFISNRQVVVGMKAEHVLRAWGQPTKKDDTGEREQWIYSKRVVTFERGIVTRLDDAR